MTVHYQKISSIVSGFYGNKMLILKVKLSIKIIVSYEKLDKNRLFNNKYMFLQKGNNKVIIINVFPTKM